MFKWIRQKHNQEITAIIAGIIPNILAVYFVAKDLFFYTATKPIFILTFFLLFLVIVALVKDTVKIWSKIIFVSTLTMISLVTFKLIVSFLIDFGYWEI